MGRGLPGTPEVRVAAFDLRADAALAAADLDQAFDRLPRAHRPRYVQVVPDVPLTTWHRPVWRDLQRAGVPTPRPDRQVWRLDRSGAHYELLT